MPSSEEKPSAAALEATETKKKPRSCKRHCLRFWWAYLIAFVLVALLIILLIIFVAVPKIAQKKINQAELEIRSINISQSNPDYFYLDVDNVIRTDGSVHATVLPFEADMFLADGDDETPFGRVNFPETKSEKETFVTVGQRIDIVNMAAMTKFTKALLGLETLQLTILGKPKVKLPGLARKYGVTFKKTVTLKGINHFSGLTVADEVITFDTSNNFRANATIPNASIFTIEIGNATFANFFNNANIGTVYIENLTLRPGNITVPIRADIQQSPVVTAIIKEPYCETGIIPFTLRGTQVTNHDQNITYYADALAIADQVVDVNVGTPLAALKFPTGCSSNSTS